MRAATKLLSFAVMLVSLSVASVATGAPILFSTCEPGGANVDQLFPGAAEFCETQSLGYTTTATSQVASFDFESGFPNITDELSFEGVILDFEVNLTAFFVEVGNANFLSRIPSIWTPEVFDTSRGDRWMYFRVENKHAGFYTVGAEPPQPGSDYTPQWEQIITYFAANNDGSDREYLHDDRPLGIFGATPITTKFDPHCDPGGYDCEADPAIGGRDDDFSDSTVVAAVPEPASLLLLGSALVGLVYQRRRAKR